MFSQVILFQKTGLGDDTLTYEIPEEMELRGVKIDLKPGALVDVPLRNKIVRGVVLSITEKSPIQGKTKKIDSVIHEQILPEWKMELINWLAKNYHTSKSTILKHLIPPYFREKKGKASEMLELLKSPEQKPAKEIGNKKSKKVKSPSIQLVQHQEDFLKSIKEAIEKTTEKNPDGQILIIAPEIAVSPWWAHELEKEYDAINYNKAKTPKQKAVIWKEIFEGKHRVIYGSRSTLLSPCTNLQSIIIINEHSIGHKEDQRPKYHSRDLALEIQKLAHTDLTFIGPSITLPLWHVMNPAIHLTRRTDTQFKVIDMKNERKAGNFAPLSEELVKILTATLEHKSQAILFLNKRGDSSCLLCRDCGYIPKCPICSKNLIVQRHSQYGYALACIAGEVIQPVPEACPKCGNIELEMVGVGQEKLVTALEKLFPKASIEIYSKERAKTPKDQQAILKKFSDKKIDILITTQLLYSGAPIPQVPVIAALNIDTGLTIPHFMSTEKTLHHLQEIQTFLKPKGIFLLQTYIPDNPLLSLYRNQQINEWYEKEMSSRKRFNYPPFSKILVLTSTRREGGKENLENTIKYIKATQPDLNIELNKKHIGHREVSYIIIRGADPEKAMETIKSMPDVSLDIDSPYLI
ncbi:MAG: primosomal protein N' [Candidatus Gracilibacteria bacterium]